MQRWRCNQPRLLLSPPYLRLAYRLEIRVSTSVVPSIAEVLPSTTSADDLSTEMDFTASQVNEDNTPFHEGSWNTVSANQKPALTARPRSELITVGIQLPPGTLTPKLPFYDLLSTIIAAANLSPKTSAEVTLQAKPAQSLVFLKTHSPLTAHLLLSLTSRGLNGHRAHQCPKHSVPAKCRRCASPLPADSDAHVCAQPWCIHCQVNTHSSLDSTCPYLLAKQRDCAKAAFLRRTAMRRATQPSPPSSSAHEFLSPPATAPPGSYAAKVKGTPPMYTSSSNTPSPSLSNESRSFDLRLAMLERNQREQQRVSDELQQKIPALTQTLATTTSSLTSQLMELNKQLTTLTAPTSSSHVTKLADIVKTNTSAQHTRLVQLENSIVRILTTIETQSKQLESFTYMLNSLQESLPPAKKKERARVGASSTSKT
ncbi:hypothetical protein HPB51_021923 [Rhipicephalus microplus]|uniref:Uncharacterized protein n=1 Tax=Rhipicephalus microplus TaxID=6941 RepID=A0A9J6E3D5_RHIMP|nr:hypothetical protein HPB51_021923 [Rhipicephalus microplus]